jgi:hypothetical protein
METYNSHIQEIEEFSQQALENQGKIGQVTVELANENVIEAKSQDDEPKLERSISTRVKAEIATKQANKLAEVQLTRGTTPTFDWTGIVQMLLTGLGAAFPAVGGVAMLMHRKIGRMKVEGQKYADSSDKNQLSRDFL